MLTRDEVLDRLNEIIVAPLTRTIRGLRTEVLLTEEDGMPAACAAPRPWSEESLRLRDVYAVRATLARGTSSLVDGMRLPSGMSFCRALAVRRVLLNSTLADQNESAGAVEALVALQRVGQCCETASPSEGA